jgi:hypothetical protein
MRAKVMARRGWRRLQRLVASETSVRLGAALAWTLLALLAAEDLLRLLALNHPA